MMSFSRIYEPIDGRFRSRRSEQASERDATNLCSAALVDAGNFQYLRLKGTTMGISLCKWESGLGR
jgi:hypothetical protein